MTAKKLIYYKIKLKNILIFFLHSSFLFYSIALKLFFLYKMNTSPQTHAYDDTVKDVRARPTAKLTSQITNRMHIFKVYIICLLYSTLLEIN